MTAPPSAGVAPAPAQPRPSTSTEPPRAVRAGLLLAVFIIGVLGASAGIPARATYGARTTADEPYYLLTALSLVQDGDLDISDELDDRAYASFHEIPVDPQTAPLDSDGRHVSPHDPLLPLLLAPAVGLAGWAGAKVLLVGLAGLTAVATVVLAVRTFGVRPRVAALVVSAASLSMPLAPYGSQVYPELPAALLVVLGVGAVAALGRPGTQPGTRAGRVAPAVVAAVVIALPWASVKYVPVAAALAALAGWRLWRGGRRRTVLLVGVGLGVCGVVYLAAHQVLYGGWTVYAAGDHFAETGELAVVGVAPDHLGRARRLVGLLVDRSFGIGTWAPLWLAGPAGIAATLASWHPDRWVLLAPLAAGWLTATFVALTMHGWWVPGRQVVVVLPLLVIAVAVLIDRLPRLVLPAALAGVLGASSWLWSAWESSTGRRTLVVDLADTGAWGYRALAAVTPDGIVGGTAADVLLGVWTAALLTSAAVAWRTVRERDRKVTDRQGATPC